MPPLRGAAGLPAGRVCLIGSWIFKRVWRVASLSWVWLQGEAPGADATPVRSVVRPRLADAFTDTVLDGMGELCRLLDQASPAFWQELAATGTAMSARPSRDLEHCVQIALASNRAAMLTYALELLDQQIAVTLAAHPGGARQSLEPARLPLAAAVSVMVLADLLDPATYIRLTAPLTDDLRP
jgi:hypothetical protein